MPTAWWIISRPQYPTPAPGESLPGYIFLSRESGSLLYPAALGWEGEEGVGRRGGGGKGRVRWEGEEGGEGGNFLSKSNNHAKLTRDIRYMVNILGACFSEGSEAAQAAQHIRTLLGDPKTEKDTQSYKHQQKSIQLIRYMCQNSRGCFF
jgi:hypothetical protein